MNNNTVYKMLSELRYSKYTPAEKKDIKNTSKVGGIIGAGMYGGYGAGRSGPIGATIGARYWIFNR